MSGKIIYYNKYLLDYIFSFDDTHVQNYKIKLVFSKVIQEASHNYWYKYITYCNLLSSI
jgi:hypothetical protein